MAARILLVDDEPSVRSTCARILSSRGYAITACSSALEALNVVESLSSVDLLLTDVRMPGMDGIRLAGDLRKRFPRLRIIVMTAFPTIDSAVDSLRLGTKDYLVKPFDVQELLDHVSMCLQSLASDA